MTKSSNRNAYHALRMRRTTRDPARRSRNEKVLRRFLARYLSAISAAMVQAAAEKAEDGISNLRAPLSSCPKVDSKGFLEES